MKLLLILALAATIFSTYANASARLVLKDPCKQLLVDIHNLEANAFSDQKIFDRMLHRIELSNIQCQQKDLELFDEEDSK